MTRFTEEVMAEPMGWFVAPRDMPAVILHAITHLNTLRPRQNGRHFADDIFKCIFLNENVWVPLKISLKFVPKGPINNIPAMVQIMAWSRPGNKPLSEPMMVRLPTHICVTQPQWVNLHIDKWPLQEHFLESIHILTEENIFNLVVGTVPIDCFNFLLL